MSKTKHVALAIAMLGLLWSADANAQTRVGLNAVGAYTFITGPAGNALSGGWGGEGTLFIQSKNLRFGAGLNYASIKTDEQVISDAWKKMFLYGSVGSSFQASGRFVSHFDVRLGWSQLTPDESLAIEKGSGFGMGLVGGVEISMSPNFAFDLSAAGDYFHIGDVNLNQADVDTFSFGWAWGLRAGFTIKI
jgi:opacity protein-like surface antigen